MSIQKKLILSYGAMIVIPILLFSIVVGAMYIIFSSEEGWWNPANDMERIEHRNSIFAELKLVTTDNPDMLVDQGFLQKMDETLGDWKYGLFMRVDNDVIYSSDQGFDKAIATEFSTFGSFTTHTHESVMVNGNPYKFRQHDFYLPDGRKGSIFLVEETSNIEQFAEQNSLTIFILCIMIILLTSGFLSFLLSRNIVKPIKALQESTRQIKEGNLDYALRKDRNDEIGELMADFEDMRQKLKRSEELQLQYEQDRKLLISNISHDLKTPISSIKGYVQGIQEGIAFSEERKNKYLTTIYRRAHEMDVLINELFLFSTLDLKQEKFHFQRINLTAFLQDCIDDFQHVFEKQGIELEGLPLNESDLHVMADREKLTRVMNNLFQNSMKFMDNSEGKISLHLQRKGDAVLIAVEDNGPGIPKEEVGQIFETFYQVDASRTKTRTGSGLGLAIAKQIINEHKGEIWAESKEGKGTKIIIQLPLDDSEERGQ